MKCKRVVSLFLTLIMVIGVFAIPVNADSGIKVLLDGQELDFDVPPQLINSRTMVPMRKIFEAMGANVDWNGNTQTVTATKNDITVIMQIDNTVIKVNGENITLDVPPQLVDSRTLVPARAVAESLKAKVEWDGENNTVIINSIPQDPYGILANWIRNNGKKEILGYTNTFEEGNRVYYFTYDDESNLLSVSSHFIDGENICHTNIVLDSLEYSFNIGDIVHYGRLVDKSISDSPALYYYGFNGQAKFDTLEQKYAFLEKSKHEVFNLMNWMNVCFSKNNLNITTNDFDIPLLSNKMSPIDAHEILKKWIKDNGKANGGSVVFNIPNDQNKVKAFVYDANNDYVCISDSMLENGKIEFFTIIKLLQERGNYKYGCTYAIDSNIQHQVTGEIEPKNYEENTPIKYVTSNVPNEYLPAFLEFARTSNSALLLFAHEYMSQCIGSISLEDFGFESISSFYND